ncbi:MAG: hypothetical protein COA85_10640 [Robiginitomaculum sp.]|nr:MAG: hypothetical protein COA85_10640 [Robiginitomaculum sp.]
MEEFLRLGLSDSVLDSVMAAADKISRLAALVFNADSQISGWLRQKFAPAAATSSTVAEDIFATAFGAFNADGSRGRKRHTMPNQNMDLIMKPTFYPHFAHTIAHGMRGVCASGS